MADVLDRGVARLELERGNGELTAWWLAQRRSGRMPPRGALEPLRLKSFLPNALLFDVIPDWGVHLRFAGTRIGRLLAVEGAMDWIEAAGDGASRLALFSRVARGALARAALRFPQNDGANFGAQTILLPFAPAENEVTTVLAHVHIRPDRYLKLGPLSPAAEFADVSYVDLDDGAAAAEAA